jgi:hypothetical protein
VVFKDFYKVTSVKNTIVFNIDKPHKDGTMKSESEITMWDRMQMYNTVTKHKHEPRTWADFVDIRSK